MDQYRWGEIRAFLGMWIIRCAREVHSVCIHTVLGPVRLLVIRRERGKGIIGVNGNRDAILPDWIAQ